MKAAIALLADCQVQNYVRRMVFELEQAIQIKLLASLLPAHISLKQPFSFENMDRLESYFDALAAQIAPFQIALFYSPDHQRSFICYKVLPLTGAM